MVHCSRCGHEITDDARFCPSCGAAVAGATPPPGAAEAGQCPPSPIEPAAGPALPVDVRNMAMLCHLSSFAGLLIPLANIFGPLLVWILKREQSPFIDDHGKESLNWQLSATIYFIVCALLLLVVVGIVLLPALFIFDLVVVIIATVRASNGEPYRYPLSIRFIR